MRCDFCSGFPVVAKYTADDFIAYQVGGVSLASTGAWAACRVCERLLDGDRWPELVARVLKTFRENFPEFGSLPDGVLESSFYDLYAGMIQHKFKKGKL